MTPIELIIAAVSGLAATWATTWLVLKLLIRYGIFDTPNERSSHAHPKPRGGGLAVLAVLLPSWGLIHLLYGATPPGFVAILAATLVLAAISWLDDVRSQPVALRLIAQFAAAGIGIGFTTLDNGSFLLFQGVLPNWIDHGIKAFAWVWFINLFNFMDGADGITGVETFAIGLGLTLLALLTTDAVGAAAYPTMLAACALGFLYWNWAPSKIFLGDVGSVGLGYLIGWLLLVSAAQGYWAAALLLPLYYLCDATMTLCRRALRGEKIWRGHREHFYQKAMLRGADHAWVSRALLLHNTLLILLALASLFLSPWLALTGGVLVVAVLLFRYAHYPVTPQNTTPATE